MRLVTVPTRIGLIKKLVFGKMDMFVLNYVVRLMVKIMEHVHYDDRPRLWVSAQEVQLRLEEVIRDVEKEHGVMLKHESDSRAPTKW